MLDEHRAAAVVALDDRTRATDHGDRAALFAVPVGHDRGIVRAVAEGDGVPRICEAHGLEKIEAAATRRRHVKGHGRCTEQQGVERAQEQREACSLVAAGHGGVRRVMGGVMVFLGNGGFPAEQNESVS